MTETKQFVYEDWSPLLHLHRAREHIADLEKENERLREALQEISKGEGAFNRDPLKHCSNTVEDMKAMAKAALKERGDE